MAKSHTDLSRYQIFDFKTGLDVKTSPLQLAVAANQNSLRSAKNCVYTSAGSVSKRLDQTILTSSSVGASVSITGGIHYRKSDGTSSVVFGTSAGKVSRLDSDGTVADIFTGGTTSKRYYFEVYNDKLIWGNRADVPRKSTDAATSAVLGGTPPATGGPVRVHGNRVFWLDATTKSNLTWSALNNEEDYTAVGNAGSVLVNANDGSDLIDMVPSIQELILLKGSRPYRLQGTSPATFAITNVVPTTGSVGAISDKANFFALNDVWYLATNGMVNLKTVFNFGDLQAKFASDRISPYFEAGTDFTISLQYLTGAVAAYDSQNNWLYFAVDSNADNKNDLLFVKDLRTGAFSTWTGQSIASLWPVKNSTNGQIEMYAGGYDGHIRVLNRAVSTNAIEADVRHLSALGAPGIEKSTRYGFFYFAEDNTTVSISTTFDFGAGFGKTYTASLLGNTKLLGVNWVLGVDPLGKKEQVIKRLDLSGTGEFVEFGVRNLNAGENFTWYGYDVLHRPRRLVRRGTARTT